MAIFSAPFTKEMDNNTPNIIMILFTEFIPILISISDKNG
jgi:hypothetical protein